MRFYLPIFLLFIFLQGCSMKHEEPKVERKVLLNDIWALKNIKGKPLHVKMSKQISLEFNIQKNMFHGNDGCNEIFGKVEITNEYLKFGSAGGTMMACPNMDISNLYINLLKKSKFYKIENLHLYLLDEDKKELLDFLKVD